MVEPSSHLRIRHHASGEALLRRATGFLLEAEAENNLVLGIAGDWAEYVAGLPDRPYLATAERGDRVVACALRTPPRNVVMTAAGSDELRLIAEDLERVYDELPGVTAPRATARAFAGLWSRRTGVGTRERHRLRVYRLDRVSHAGAIEGRFRAASEADGDTVLAWARAFGDETGAPMDEGRARKAVAAGSLFLWEDGRPVSMAMWQGRTPNGVRVSYVFTPPEHRGRGYATACVGALSRHLLASGHRFCFLFADSANPASNRVYRRVGYHPVCDVSDYLFDAR